MLTGELPTGKFEPPSRRCSLTVRLDEVVLARAGEEPGAALQQAGEVQTMVETIEMTPPPSTAASRPPMQRAPADVARASSP